MTTTAAAQLLDLPPDATPEQLEARFLELRRRLEEKIAKAPTPGLQAKYRASLAEITTAFETLVLAADSSLLPVLSRDDSVSTAPEVGAKPRGPAAVSPTPAPTPSRQEPKPSSRPKKGNGEFIVVTLVALVVLAAGGWWVMKTRAEKAEQTRLAAEAAAEAKAAELKRQQDAAAEADRITKLATQLRTQLAEARVTWEAYESDLRDAERRASELRSEVRGFRDGPPERKAELSALAARQDLFAQWLKAYLVRHPSKVARARAEQLLEAKAVDEAVAAVDELKAELARIEPEVKERRDYLINASARVVVLSSPLGLPYRYTDAYGRVFEGTTPGEIKGTPLTHVYDLSRDDPTLLQAGEFVAEVAQARFFRPGWPEQTAEMRLTAEDQYVLRADFPGRPTVDCLLADPTREDVLLKIFNRNGDCGVIGVFNARYHADPAQRSTLAGTVAPRDVVGLAGERFAGFAHQSQRIWTATADEQTRLELPERGWEIVSYAPVQDGFAPLGLADKFNSTGAIVAQEKRTDGAWIVTLRDGGDFVAWSERAPQRVESSGQSVTFRHDPATGALFVSLPAQGRQSLTIVW